MKPSEAYRQFDQIIEASLEAFDYASEHFCELMARPVVKKLYGPPAHGMGPIFPSRYFVKERDRKLTLSTKRTRYRMYAFGEDMEFLYSRIYDLKSTLQFDHTLLGFRLGNIQYARYFYRDKNEFYSDRIYSVMYKNALPVYCAIASRDRLYIEYQNHVKIEGKQMVLRTTYDYYPTRTVSEKGISISKAAPLGAPNSPVLVSNGVYEPVNADFYSSI